MFSFRQFDSGIFQFFGIVPTLGIFYIFTMDLKELNEYYNKFKYGEDNFHNLMQYRVKEILLISTFYDAYIFEHDARLSEQIVGEYHQLNLTTVPRITSVPNGEEALKTLQTGRFDLMITTMRPGETSPFDLSREVRRLYPELPILLLLTVKSDIQLLQNRGNDLGGIDNVFLWNGDSKLFLAMIKYVEDAKNAPYDTENGLVRVILLVEDSINFHSLYLPLLYTEVMEQAQRLITEEMNDNNKYYRMRTRPKVLLARTYEEALGLYEKYREYLLCVISDVQYRKGESLDPRAGIKLLTLLKERDAHLPMILQSSVKENQEQARLLGVDFFHKKSSQLLGDLREFILGRLGFGDFIFRTPGGREIARAEKPLDFERILPTVPEESLLYHAERLEFSSWLIAHGEFQIARNLRVVMPEDFSSVADLRQHLIEVFRTARIEHNRGRLLAFDPTNLNQEEIIIRLGRGSLGGKGRGLAFLNALLVTTELEKRFSHLRIRIPITCIIGTSEFDFFLRSNNLYDIRNLEDDNEIKKRFLESRFPDRMKAQLRQLLEKARYPLAVRSSGLLEDSQSQPFAGVYQTYMIPNSQESLDDRLEELCSAIALVYASVFLMDTRRYIEGLNYIIEEEKMAVIIQEVVGQRHGDLFYPHFSGVAQSYNYYPIAGMDHKDGVASVALGLGQTVVDGGRAFRFCPFQPLLEYLPVEEQVKSTQTEFYALDLSARKPDYTTGEYAALKRVTVREAEPHGVLDHLVSVWDAPNHRLVEGLSGPGPRVVNFANILKYRVFPLSEILQELLEMGQQALGIPVEIEFAVDLDKNPGRPPAFYVLQVRPLTMNYEEINYSFDDLDPEDIFLHSSESLGNGIITDIRDIIYVDPERFEKTKTQEVREEIRALNEKLKKENRRYLLMGPGRWGSRDQFLGIPVIWAEISGAGVIVEQGFEDFEIEPSQGTHFLHNVIAMNVGYINLPFNKARIGSLDKGWLSALKTEFRGNFCVHVSVSQPLKIIMDGKTGRSVVLKGEKTARKA